MIREIHQDRLFLGNAMDARDVRGPYDNRISAVVDLAINEPLAQLARDMVYCRFPLNDGDGDPIAVIETAIRCVISLIKNDIRTLVACSAGMSRSPAIAAAMAMLTYTPSDDCLATITSNGPHDVSPILWSCVKTVYNQIIANGD